MQELTLSIHIASDDSGENLMRRTCPVLCLIVLCLAVSRPVDADDCAKIVAAAQTKIKIKKNKSHSENIYDFACSSEFEKMVTSSSSSFNLSIPIGDGVVLGFGSNQNNAANLTRLKTFCRQRNYQLNDDEASFVYQQFLPSEGKLRALADLAGCRKMGGNLVAVELRPTDRNTVTIYAKFNRPALPDTVKIPNPTLFEMKTSGLTCTPKQLLPMAPITQGGLSDTCTWTKGQDASVTILHNSGAPATDTLPWDVDGQVAGTATLTVHAEKVGQWRLESNLHQQKPIALHAAIPTGFLYTYWYEDTFIFRVPDGKITNLSVRCVALCNAGGPSGALAAQSEVFWQTPTPEGVEVQEAGAGFKEYRSENVAPTWEANAQWWRKVTADLFKPDVVQDIKYNRAFSLLVPKNRVAARLKVAIDGNNVTINVGEENAFLELLGKSDSGDDEIYTYMVKLPDALR